MKSPVGPGGGAARHYWRLLLPVLTTPASAARLVLGVACLTAIVTIASLGELSALISAGNPDAERVDWREVAGRAVRHAESLPHLAGHRHHAQAGGLGGGGPAATQPVAVISKAEAQAVAAVAAVAAPGAAVAAAAAVAGVKPDEEDDGPPPKPPPEECNAQENTEMWGDVVKWGSTFKVKSAGECCEACKKAATPEPGKPHGCNVWVWCADKALCNAQHQECWLKHLLHPKATKPAREGPEVGWMSGIVGPDAAPDPSELPPAQTGPPRKFHIVTSAQGSAVHWQVRVHYYWYKKQKHVCERELGDRCEMGGFTRLLHSGQADDLMDEVPTFVADPLPEAVVAHDWYPVLNRPWAFMQWVQQANITEEYVLMSEPDHIFLRPIPNFMKGDSPAAFPFFYIEPHKDDNIEEIRKFVPGHQLNKSQAEEMAPIGNSPTFLSLKQMRTVMPLWANVSISVFKDHSASEKWGWVQEMYAFTISLWITGVKHVDLILNFMAQPPWDSKMKMGKGKPYYILHYTYGNDFDLKGTFTPGKYGRWRFDKRTYASRPPPRHLGEPPRGMKNDMVRALVAVVNEATQNIPCWDEYSRTGTAPRPCAEAVAPQADGFKY